MITLLANLSMLALVIGTLPSIYAALKNRDSLKGFSLIGAFGIITGQTGYFFYFILIKDYITSILTTPMIAYWIIVLIYTLKGRRKNE